MIQYETLRAPVDTGRKRLSGPDQVIGRDKPTSLEMTLCLMGASALPGLGALLALEQMPYSKRDV